MSSVSSASRFREGRAGVFVKLGQKVSGNSRVVLAKLTNPISWFSASSILTPGTTGDSGRLIALVSPRLKLALILGSMFWLTCLLPWPAPPIPGIAPRCALARHRRVPCSILLPKEVI